MQEKAPKRAKWVICNKKSADPLSKVDTQYL